MFYIGQHIDNLSHKYLFYSSASFQLLLLNTVNLILIILKIQYYVIEFCILFRASKKPFIYCSKNILFDSNTV